MGRPKTIEDEDLLKIAREVFLEGGALGSTKEIAARAGISEAALFKRYSTKSALFLAAMAPARADTGWIFGKVSEEKDPHRAIQQLARQMLAHYRTAIPRMLPLITHPAIGMDELRKRIDADGANNLDRALTRWLQEQHAAGYVTAPNPRASAMVLVAMLHSIVLFEIIGVHGGTIPDAVVGAMVDAVWNGLARRERSAPKRRRKT